jgi:ribose transport system ATP-binding protein
MSEALVIKTEKICKDFSTVTVLKDISIGLAKGEILGLIGENGAGKSTLMKILAGIYQPTSGKVFLSGEERIFRSPSDAKAAGVSIVPQEFNLCPDLSVSENVFLGAELTGGKGRCGSGFLDESAMRRRTKDLLSDLGSSIDPEEPISSLSAAQKQLVEICKALVYDARVLILDEPTTVLTKVEIESLFRVMRGLKERGISMIYISHKLAEVREVCDRVAVLRDGELVHVAPSADLALDEMARRMVGRELSDIFPELKPPREGLLLEVENLSSPGVFEGVSFSLRSGEILGLAGLVGAGRTEVAEAIMALRPSSGRVAIGGRELARRRPQDAVAAGIGYLSEDRQGSGVMVPFSVAENATLVSLPAYSVGPLGLVDARRERESAERWRQAFSIKASSVDQVLEELSGGNQQKVSLAKSLDPSPKVLIVDEPTRGVDVGAKHEIYRLIADLAAEGMAILFISSELEEVIGMCDRVLVMREGRPAGIVEGAAVNEEEIMYLATGIREGA